MAFSSPISTETFPGLPKILLNKVRRGGGLANRKSLATPLTV
jgi:hypothetical protein